MNKSIETEEKMWLPENPTLRISSALLNLLE